MQPAYKNIGAAIAVAPALALAACGQAPDQPESAATTATSASAAPAVVAPGDWPLINRDLRANRFSPLTEITAANVATLASSWTYQLGGNSTAVPIVVAGVMYLPSRDRVVALDGDTGALVWEYVLPAPPAARTPAVPQHHRGPAGAAAADRRRRRAASATGQAMAPRRRASCS